MYKRFLPQHFTKERQTRRYPVVLSHASRSIRTFYSPTLTRTPSAYLSSLCLTNTSCHVIHQALNMTNVEEVFEDVTAEEYEKAAKQYTSVEKKWRLFKK